MRHLEIRDWSSADRCYLEFNKNTHPVHRVFTKAFYHFSHREDVVRTRMRVRGSEGWEWKSFLKPCSRRLLLWQFGSLCSDSSSGGDRGQLRRRLLLRSTISGILSPVPFGRTGLKRG